MTFDNTVQPAVDLLDSLGPWGPLVGILVAFIGPKLLPLVARLGPVAVAVYTLFLGAFKRKATPQPAPPPAEVERPKHPLLHEAMSILRMAALQRFSYLPPDEALLEYAKEHVRPVSPQAVEDLAHQFGRPFFTTEAVVTPAPATIRDFTPSPGD